MATWDQGNSGGLLAGIGNNNVNAPQASDANTALGLIRQNNEDERSGRNNVGLQTLQGITSVAQSYQQVQQEQRKQEFQKAYAGAYSSGDRNAMRQLASQYPDQFEAVRNGMGFIDEDQRNTVGSLASTARLAAQSPEAMGQWLRSNASELARVGVNPGDVATMYQQNPQGFGEFADHLGMSAIGPEKYFDLQDKAVGREIDRGKLAETVRSNQAGEGLQARGHDITLRGQNITAQNAALDREIKRSEIQDKVLDRQIARETNQVKLDGLRQQQAAAQQKGEEAKIVKQQAAQQTYDTFNTALDTIKDLKEAPGLKSAVGMSSMLPTRPGSDAADFEAKLDTFKAQTFLPMVQSMKGMGALSDAEGKKLTDAVGALSPKMSEAEFTKSLNKIEGQLRGKLANAQATFGVPMQQAPSNPPPDQKGGGFSTLWGE
ncbi:phage DNA ejection protein [Yersinia alsatica]|uniref:phage DNA ejection protein n=1 Tax=Yersinia alsatica TaxID=2890317 RepID=UPI00119E5DD5|nr:phage DNA ejection protein [Yersinia alsatica]